MMLIEPKSFFDCTAQEIFEFYHLRSEVFVVEQVCAYQDVDEKDLKALHIMMRDDTQLLAYCRIIPPGVSYNETAIGRVVVPLKFRKKGLARELMTWSIRHCLKQYPNKDIVISAQTYLIKFYEDLNFIIEGETYLEDNIPHIKMRYQYPMVS